MIEDKKLPGGGGQEGTGGRKCKGDKETFGDKGYVHYHCDDGFTDVYICQSLSNCTLPICSVYCIPIISQQSY